MPRNIALRRAVAAHNLRAAHIQRTRRLIALAQEGEGETPEWLPEGAVAFIDFENEHYYMDGAEVAVTDILGSDVPAGYTFDVGDIGASGWGDPSSNLGAVFKGAAKATLLAGATIVVHGTIDAGEFSGGFVFTLFDTPDFNATYDILFNPGTVNMGDGFGGEAGIAENDGWTANAANRAAFTVTPTNMAYAVNGVAGVGTPFNPQNWTSPALDTVGLTASAGCTIHSVTIYEPVADAALPALSALTPEDWLPEGATLYADWVNERAWDGSEEVEVTDLFAWNVGNYSGDDWERDFDGSTSFTVVVEFDKTEGHDFSAWMFDDPNFNEESYVRAVEAETGISVASGEDTDTTSALANGIHKVAFTWTPTTLAASFDGGAVLTATRAMASAANRIAFVSAKESLGTRTVTFLAAVENAALPALSAL